MTTTSAGGANTLTPLALEIQQQGSAAVIFCTYKIPSASCLSPLHHHFPQPRYVFPNMSMSKVQERKTVVEKSTYRDLAAKNPNFTESATPQ